MKPDTYETHLERWGIVKAGRAGWTKRARLCLKVLAGCTWNTDELAVFEAQDREPPNYNLTLPMLKIIAGIEAQNRSDEKYLPRGKADVKSAEAATKLGMYVRDQNSADRQISRSFWDVLTTGVGFQEVGINPDPTAERVMRRRLNPFYIWPDPAHREPDMSDAKDVFRAVPMYAEDLARLFPKFKREILALAGCDSDRDMSHTRDYTNEHGDRPPVTHWESQAENGAAHDQMPKQLVPVERWYRQDEWAKFARFKDGRVVEITPKTAVALAGPILDRRAKVVTGFARRIRVAVFLEGLPTVLQDAESPYSHGKFPIVKMVGYVDENDQPMSIIWNVISPQRDLNARMAHSLKRALTRQTHYETDAFVDLDEATEALGRADGMVEYAPGALSSGKVDVRDNLAASAIEADIAQLDIKMISDYSGATAELQGQETNAVSGTAINQRAAQGQTRLHTLFDARNATQEQCAELTLALIQQEYTEEQEVRLTESETGADFLTINGTDPMTGASINSITQGRFDYKVTQVNQKATERLAGLEQLANFLSTMPPEVKMLFASKMAKMADIPDAEEVAEKIDAMVEQMLVAAQQGAHPNPQGAPRPPGGNPVPPQGLPQPGMQPAA